MNYIIAVLNYSQLKYAQTSRTVSNQTSFTLGVVVDGCHILSLFVFPWKGVINTNHNHNQNSALSPSTPPLGVVVHAHVASLVSFKAIDQEKVEEATT